MIALSAVRKEKIKGKKTGKWAIKKET